MARMARIRLHRGFAGHGAGGGRYAVAALPAVPAGAARLPRAAASVTAHVWVTTPDGTDKLTPLAPATFGSAVPTAPTIVVDPTLTYQTMQGFGGAITDSSATVLYRLSPAARAATMRSLFDPVTGDGLDYLRQPIGASDFVATADYTYDDLPAGQTDYAAEPLLRSSTTRRRSCRCCARPRRSTRGCRSSPRPWSPPAWMKTNGSLIGGRLIDDPRIYRSYALYLLKFVQAYRANGVTVNAITVQNEPQNRTPSGYPGTDMPSSQEEKVIEDLGPMLRAAGLRTQIFAYDHNWTEHPNDVAATPPDETADINAYPQNVLKSPAARYVAGVAYHCYFGDPSAMTTLHDQFPDKAIYFTECSGSQSADPANTFSDTLKWHARNLIIGSPRNWAQTVINWNLALDPSGGPHVGGCATCTPHRHRRPGRHRDQERGVLHARAPGPVRAAGGGAHRQHLVRHHRVERAGHGRGLPQPRRQHRAGGAQRERQPALRSGSARAARRSPTPCPAGRWPPSPGAAPRPGRTPCARSTRPGWTATASPAGPTDPCCTGDVAANAADGDASTRYSTGAAQTSGQYLQVDFGRTVAARQVVFDTGVSDRRLPARLHGHGQHRRRELEHRGQRPGHRPVHRGEPERRPGPVRPDDAHRVQRKLVERRRRPRLHALTALAGT